MTDNINRVICFLLLGLIGASCPPQHACADEEPTGVAGGPVMFLAAGALAVNAGATIANGSAVLAGKPNRGNGMFGVVLGGVTIAAGAVGLAFSDSDTDSETFSIVLAGCGLASLLTGYLNVKGAGGSPAETGQTEGFVPRVLFGPYRTGRAHGWVAALQVGL